MQDGSTLDITLGSGNTTDAVLTLDAALSTASLSLQLTGVYELTTGAYKLITLADAASYSADSWTESLVNVTGGSFERLSWRDGTLYYRATSIVVEHGDSDTITDALLQEADYSPIVIREGVALFQQEHAAPLVVSYDSTTTEAGRLAQIDRSASFARLNVGAPEGSENVLQVEEEQTASTAALNGAGDLAKSGRGELTITGAGDHSGTLTVRQGRVTLAEGGWVSVTTGGNLIQLSTEQLAGGSLTLELGANLLAEARLVEGSEAELWLAGLTAAEGSALTCEEVQGGTERLAVTIRSITREEGGTRLHLVVTAAVPEPATGTLTLLALAGLAARRRRK